MNRHPRPHSADRWSEDLRQRLVEIASRRVPEGEVEDLVQDAMATILVRSPEIEEGRLVEGHPPIAWCFTVLRNVIGNYYQRRGRWQTVEAQDTMDGLRVEGTPSEALERKELAGLVQASMDELHANDTQCFGFLRRLVEGAKPRVLASEAGLEEAVLYRRLYRCRQKLQRLLEQRGVWA